MELKGLVKKVMDVQTFDSGFRKREIVITTQEQYPQDIIIEFHSDKCDLLNNLKVGKDIVEIGINLRGREWVSPDGIAKYFNSIVGWRINVVSSTATHTEQHQNNEPVHDDDLPF